MNKRINLLLCIAVFAGIITSKAQTTFYLDGYGRALYTTDKLKGDLIDSDSLTNTTNKGVSGYTLFDLGLNLEKDKTFKANAILRARNQFGLFFGDGTRLEFRQIQLEGIIGKGVKYEIGDIDIKMTPFTVFNSEEMYNEFESDIFAQRRGILEYENFNSSQIIAEIFAFPDIKISLNLSLDTFRGLNLYVKYSSGENVEFFFNSLFIIV